MKLSNILVIISTLSFLLISSLKASDLREEATNNKSVSSITLTHLPDEIIAYIFSYLDSKTLFACEAVSQKFFEIVQHIWEREDKEIVIKNPTPEKIVSFIKDRRPFRSLDISKIKAEKSPLTLKDLSLKASLRSLNISGHLLYPLQLELLSNFTTLTSLKMNRVIIFDIGDTLRGLSNLTNLIVLEANTNHLAPKALQYITTLSSLKSLDISNNLALDHESLDPLKSLKSLQQLNLKNTNIKQDTIQELRLHNATLTIQQ